MDVTVSGVTWVFCLQVIQRVVMILEAALQSGELEPAKPKGPSELSQFYTNRNWKTSARKGKLAAMFGKTNEFAVEPERNLKLLRAHNARRGHLIFHYGEGRWWKTVSMHSLHCSLFLLASSLLAE